MKERKKKIIDSIGKKLSIITPFYNTLSYTKKLAEVLDPQLTEEVEWIIIDDGTNEAANGEKDASEPKIDGVIVQLVEIKNAMH